MGQSPRCSSTKLLSNMTFLLARLLSEYSWVLALVSDWITRLGNSSSVSTKICQNRHLFPWLILGHLGSYYEFAKTGTNPVWSGKDHVKASEDINNYRQMIKTKVINSGQSQQTRMTEWTNQSVKQIHVTCTKRGKTRVTKSWVVLVLHLIGWVGGVNFWTFLKPIIKRSEVYVGSEPGGIHTMCRVG